MEQQLKIYNGQIITPSRIIDGGTILVENGKITAINESNIDAPGAIEIDAGGKYISPGFIDIHIHGGGGHDFMDNTVEAFLAIADTHVKYGTTAMLPTTLTSSKEDLLETLRIYEIADKQNFKGSQFIGMHLEGPYFSLDQCGAQDPRYIRDPDPEEYKEILSVSSIIKRWSAAPELKGAIEFGRYVTSQGVLAAIAHTDAVYEDVLEAFQNGYTLATHLYSGMSGVTRRNAFRYAGVIESAYLIDEMDVEIIADGVHLPPPLLKLVYKIKGPQKIALITDAMRAAAMTPGESVLGSLKNGIKVIVEDGVAKLPDRSCFAGSVATANRLVRNMIIMADVPLLEAVQMATITPANIMKIADKKGSLTIGKDADIVIFDDDINVEMTIIKGNIIYDRRDAMHRFSTLKAGNLTTRFSTLKAGNLTTRIYENRTIMSNAAADLVAGKIKSLLEEQAFVNMIFAAAPSQNEFLASLTKINIDWTKVNAFHMDEYIGLAQNDPRTFASYLNENIFRHLPFHSINCINGNAADLQAECSRYAGMLMQFPPDLVCMGIGENAHIAFNDPHVANFNDPLQVKIVNLDAECRQQQVNDGCFAKLTEVPTHALTLTIPALMSAKYIYCVVPGEKKANAVYHTLYGEITAKYPSTILRKHTNAVLFLDSGSSTLVQV